MEKVKIKLVTIGHLPLHLNLKQVSACNSEVFELVGGVDNFDLRCDSDGPSWEFSDELLREQLPAHTGADFLLAIVSVPIESNWYSRRLGNNQIVFTFSQIREFLAWENIPLENAILRVLYAYTLLYRRSGNPLHIAFAKQIEHWDYRLILNTAQNYFRAVIRRHPSKDCWAWAVEWNAAYRLVGYFGERDNAQSLFDELPPLPAESVIEARDGSHFCIRAEQPISDSQDTLFST
jgi:hypothetical protein